MPHCIIEHSKAISPNELLEATHRGLLKSQIFSEEDIKIRTVDFEAFKVIPNNKNFIHVTIKILSGRTLETQKNLSNIVLNELKSLSLANISLTVEILEINNNSYAKHVV